MSSVNLTYIKPKNSLQTAAHMSDLTNSIVTKVKDIENYLELKHDKELLLLICNCIENALQGKKIDKKALCLGIMDKLFILTPTDILILSSSIDFLCNNNLVALVPTFKKYSTIVSNYIKNKL